MNNFMLLAAAEQAAGKGQTTVVMVVYIVVFILLIYFMIFKPQKKQQAKMEDISNAMAVGDSVITTTGFYGVIIDINDELDGGVVVVEFGSNKNCRIPMRKTAIQKLEKPDGTTIEL